MLNFLNKKFHKRYRIGFVIEKSYSYNRALASTRLRCYDIINSLKGHDKYILEFFNPDSNYDTVIFQKCFSADYIALADKLQKVGTKIILDININVVDLQGEISIFNEEEKESLKQQSVNIKQMIQKSDHVLVSSPILKEIYSKYHSSVFCIEENITDNFFKAQKAHLNDGPVNILYCGYSSKAIEILTIKDVLLDLNKTYDINLLFISDKNPDIQLLPNKFIKYNQGTLYKDLLKADIKIAPRDLNNSYNIGHSFTKVGYPMAVGIPAVASPVPSYINREVLVCDSLEKWHYNLKKLITDAKYRNYIGNRSREFVKANFNTSKITNEYLEFFNYVLNENQCK